MAVGYIDTEHLTDIANAIRQQNGTATLYKPSEMAQAVLDLDGTSAGSPGTEPYKTVTSGVVSRRHIQAIANAIRTQNGLSTTYKPEDMAQAILDLTWSTLAPRALLLSDGTLEFTYLNDATSPTGGTVTQVFTPVESLTAPNTAPWASVRTTITAVRFHSSYAGAGMLDISYWFYGCSNMVTVYGFENVSGITTARYAFASCSKLETVYASSFATATLASAGNIFYSAELVCGGYGGRPSSTTGSATMAVGSASATAGVLTNPSDDARAWAYAHLYTTGLLEIGATDSPDPSLTVSAHFRVPYNTKMKTVSNAPWWKSRTQVTSVAFKADMASLQQLCIAYWLMNLSNVTSIAGIANLGGVVDMTYAFACTGVATLDFRGFDASNLGSGSLMATFYDCDSLTTIYADSTWALPAAASGTSCFSGCDVLVGGAGTTYSSSRVGYTYFRIDTAATPGYLTAA